MQQLPLPLLILLFLTSAERALTTHPCPGVLSRRMILLGDSCFGFNDSRVTWLMAQEVCQRQFGRLVSIPDAQTQTSLGEAAAALWPNQNYVWIGLYQRTASGSFAWDGYNRTAQPGSFYNWHGSGSNVSSVRNKCVRMGKSLGWKWTVTSCEQFSYTFVCEYPAVVTTPITIVSTEYTRLVDSNLLATTNDPIQFVSSISPAVTATALRLMTAMKADSTELSTLGDRNVSAPRNDTDLLSGTAPFDEAHISSSEEDTRNSPVLISSFTTFAVLLVISMVSVGVFLHMRKRQSRRSMLTSSQENGAASMISNPAYTIDAGSSSPTFEHYQDIERPQSNGYTYASEWPTTDADEYQEVVEGSEHIYADPLEPRLPSSSVVRRVTPNALQQAQTGSAEEPAVHVESDSFAYYANEASANTVSGPEIREENLYVDAE